MISLFDFFLWMRLIYTKYERNTNTGILLRCVVKLMQRDALLFLFGVSAVVDQVLPISLMGLVISDLFITHSGIVNPAIGPNPLPPFNVQLKVKPLLYDTLPSAYRVPMPSIHPNTPDTDSRYPLLFLSSKTSST